MIKVKKYSMTIKQMCFVGLMMPIIAIIAYSPTRADNWTLQEYLLIVLLGLTIYSMITIIAIKEQIVFSDSEIFIKKYKKVIRKYDWNSINNITVDYILYIRKYTIKFGNDTEYTFEASKSKMNKIIEMCPIEKIRYKLVTLNKK